MWLGYLGIFYLVFTVWTVWFSKKKAKNLIAKLIYTFLSVLVLLLLTSFSFWPKATFHIESFPLNLDRRYVEAINQDDFTVVIYKEIDESQTINYGFTVFHRFLGGYIESGVSQDITYFINSQTDELLPIKSFVYEEEVYFLLFNDDLKSYESLVIGEQNVSLIIYPLFHYTLFKVERTSEEPLTITLNGQMYEIFKIE
jgi:hypothetical protein